MVDDLFGIVLILVILFLFLMVPISCHQNIVRKQAIMEKAGVEVSYWDVFWADPQVVVTNGAIAVKDSE